MGRTVPSFRNVLAMEKKNWKPFRDALDKKDRKLFFKFAEDTMHEILSYYRGGKLLEYDKTLHP